MRKITRVTRDVSKFRHSKHTINSLVTSSLGQVNITDPTKPPLKLKFGYIFSYRIQKKCKKRLVTRFGLDFYVCYYESPYSQGQ